MLVGTFAAGVVAVISALSGAVGYLYRQLRERTDSEMRCREELAVLRYRVDCIDAKVNGGSATRVTDSSTG